MFDIEIKKYTTTIADVNSTSKICDVRADNTCTAPSQTTNSFLYVLMLAQFVHGIGFTPVFTLGTAYVDDNARSESTAVYLGEYSEYMKIFSVQKY